jgi:hypothetical protein
MGLIDPVMDFAVLAQRPEERQGALHLKCGLFT